MECKNCKAELEEGVTVCPSCGQEVEMEKAAPKKKIKLWQLILVILAGVVLLLSLSVVVYWGAIGVESFDEGVQSITKLLTPRENNVYYKDSYSVSDEKAIKKKDKVVATVGDAELTNGMLQLYYWMDVYDFLKDYGYYAVYYGLDYTKPLDEQFCSENDGSWQHYFLENSLTGWHNYQAMALMAKEEGMELNEAMQSELDNLRSTLTEKALESGYTSIDAMLQKDFGPGCTYEDYYNYMKVYYTGYMYYGTKYEEFEISDADLEAYFTEHESELLESGVTKDSGNLVDVRHILVAIEGGTEDEDGNMTYTDEEWATCEAEAQKLLDQWLEGEKTEKSFAELAYEHSEDTGSNTNGGLYQGLNEDSGFVEEFTAWYMDENRKVGDYGLIRTKHGYHVMYFSAAEAEWIRNCRDGLLNDMTLEFLHAAGEKYPMDVNYKNIVLGVVDLNTES